MRHPPHDPSHSAAVVGHYSHGSLTESLIDALRQSGKNLAELQPRDLFAVDFFHVRGRAATIQLAERAKVKAGEAVLDVGCGIGGSARHLAIECGAIVTGIDLSPEYVDTAQALSQLVGLESSATFLVGSGLELLFSDSTFDIVWTEHVQMNVSDKAALFREFHRVLKPGGRLAFHDVLGSLAAPIHFPVPWADAPNISHLVDLPQLESLLSDAGFTVRDIEDLSEVSRIWLQDFLEHGEQSGPRLLGTHHLMGESFDLKLRNLAQNLAEHRVQIVQGIAQKGAAT